MDSSTPHPVPANVTSFQFKLIGDMTLKQFLYLLAGAGSAYLMFVFLTPFAPFLAWPLIVILTFTGVAFAFLPFQDRPLDHWLSAFLKAIYSPTKREWKAKDSSYRDNPLFQNRLNVYFSTQVVAPPPPMHAYTPPPPKEELPTPQELSQTVELAHQAQSLQVKIIETERELQQQKQGQDIQKFNVIFENLQKLVQEGQVIKQQLSQLTKEEEAPAIKVQIVPAPKLKLTTITLTSVPNVINGIVQTPAGEYLEGAVVVIHDKDGLPVRALKTNKLGQFTGSTPLPSGTYTVEVEKEGLVFDVLQMTLAGKVMPPLNIAAKGALS